MTSAADFLLLLAPKAAAAKQLYDFSTDSLAAWMQTTWSVSAGKAANNPTLGPTLFDPGADVFTNGIYHWVAQGTNQVTNDTNQLKTAYVDNADGASLNLNNAADLTADLTASQRYKYQCDARVQAGNSVQVFLISNNNVFLSVTETVLTTKALVWPYLSGTPVVYNKSMSAGEVIWLDNLSLKAIDHATIFAGSPYTLSGNVVVRAQFSGVAVDGYEKGIFACCDSVTNPRNYVAAVISRSTNLSCRLMKCVNGTLTNIVSAAFTYADNAYLEIRRSGDVFQLWYNNAQIGTDQTVTGMTGIIHGLYDTGGAGGATTFFVGANP